MVNREKHLKSLVQMQFGPEGLAVERLWCLGKAQEDVVISST